MEDKFKTPNVGMNYKDGKLFVFEEDKIIVIKVDKFGPVAWEKSAEKPYFTNCPIPDSLGYFATDAIVNPPVEGEYVHWRTREVMKFIEAHIPRPIIEEMRRFRMCGAQWKICSLAMRADALDLIQSNPAIAYVVALNNVFMGRCAKPWRRARSLVLKKRTDILKKAGFPATKSTVKILSKIAPDQLNTRLIFKLRWLLNSGNREILNLLRYLPVLDNHVISFIGNDTIRPIIGFSLLQSIAEANHSPAYLPAPYSRIYDIFRMLRTMEIDPPSKIRSEDDIEHIHGILCEMLNSDSYIFDAKDMQMEFSKPDHKNFYSDDFTIEHITTPQELREWGRRQKNCVASYARSITRGEIHIFRITAPEEATLSIVPQGQSWAIRELLSIRNSEVSEITQIYVKMWLSGELEGDGYQLKNFPFPESRMGDLHLKPLNNYRELLRLHFSKYKQLEQEHIFQENSVFVYNLIAPEKGVAGFRKINGVWDTVLLEDHYGNDLNDATHTAIAEWLWENTPTGHARQMKFNFEKNNSEQLDIRLVAAM